MKFFPLILSMFLCTQVTGQINPQKAFRCSHQQRFAQNADASRSDSLDITSTHLALDFTEWTQQNMKAVAEIEVSVLQDDTDRLVFDLENLEVSEVLVDGIEVSFDYVSPTLVIFLDGMVTAGTILTATIHYNGTPVLDTSGWGGGYWSGNMFFQLGVGFEADPHSFGRAWHPCFDNFVERSPYTLEVLTDDGRTCYAGGDLIGVEEVGQDSLLTTWQLDEHIPSYLASVAVGELVHDASAFNSMTGEAIPVWLTSTIAQQGNFLNSFANLNACLEGYEEDFGPYRWNRVGYVLVPFSSGAMEHATNIAYPAFAANGTLGFESLMAHELSHHWWGDLVTCSSQEDMWINEGMASYCEALFFEHLNGEEAYLEYVQDNHKDVLLYAHQNDGERLPVSGIGHAYTYGDHVYNKGADVAHTMRGYMGEDYFPLMTQFLEENQYSAVSSQDLIDFLDPLTDANMQAFFDGWIFQPGFPNFRVNDWQQTQVGDNYEVNVDIGQYLHYADNYCIDAPIEITLMDADPINGESQIEMVLVSGEESSFTFTTPFSVDRVLVNRSEKLNQAVLAEEQIIDEGITNFDYAEFRIDIDALGASEEVWIRAENHWAAANDPFEDPNLHLASDRFWRIEIEDTDAFQAEARIRYYGNPNANSYFDPLFFEEMESNGLTEDDIVLAYRPHPGVAWTIYPNYELNVQGNNTNFQGYIDFQFSDGGDWAWAFTTGPVGVSETETEGLLLYPNPTMDMIFLQSKEAQNYTLFDSEGRILQKGVLRGELSLQEFAKGSYTLVLDGQTPQQIVLK